MRHKKFGVYLWATASLCLWALSDHAQVVILKTDLPSVGDQEIYSNASPLGIRFDPNATGANQNWDYTGLSPQSQGVYDFVTSLQTPYLAYFFNTIGIKTQDTLNLGLVKFSDIYDFYKKTDTKYSIVGRGFSYQGIPLPANFIIEDKIYNFPLKYGDKDSTPFYFRLTDPTGTLPFRYAQTGWRVSEVDGWGKVSTPYGSFSCLRVKTKLITTDSVTLFGFTLPINRTTWEYRWMAKGEKIPVLQINGNELLGNFSVAQVQYKDVPRDLPPSANFNFSATTGTIGTEIDFNDLSTNRPTEWIWDIQPPTVTYLWGTHAGSQNIIVQFDAVGVYDIGLRVANKAGQDERLRRGLVEITAAIGLPQPAPGFFETYPNPFREQFDISFSGLPTLRTIRFFNAEGGLLQTVQTKEPRPSIQSGHWASGVYWLEIDEGGLTRRVKLIKL
jgi:hypothetical protein